MSKPFRFGLQVSSLPSSDPGSWRALARKVEDLGYSTLTVADHLDDQLAPVPALMAAADATTTLRIGSLVLCTDFRYAAVMAHEAAALDLLSGHRFELGLGAGWMTTDYETSGIQLDPASMRIARLERAIDVIDAHERLRPRPPVLVGGGGRRLLGVAARRADIVGLNIDLRRGVIDSSAGPNATATATDEKLGWIREAAGVRFGDLELHVRVHMCVVTNERAAVADGLAPAFGLTPEQALHSPHALCGTVDEIAADLVERRDRFGISYIGVGIDALDDLAPVVDRLAGT